MKRRDTSLDVLRVLACIMVVLMHSPIPSDNAVGSFLTAMSYFTAPCIGLFFMVSGALLLPVRTDYFTFIRRRFSKIAVPTLVWSVVYIAVGLYVGRSTDGLLRQLVSLPFSNQGSGVLWFMYTLSGLYLLAPILSSWCERASQRELQLVLALWVVTLCYPVLDFYFITNTSTTGILYYFRGYAGYFLLGYYLRRYPRSVSMPLCAVVSLVGVALLLSLKHWGVSFDFYKLFWYESVFIAALCVVVWKTVVRLLGGRLLPSQTERIVVLISNLSFGIYLCHILIMREWLWHQEWIHTIGNYLVQTLVVMLVTFLLSTVFCFVISKIPGSQWVIGYNSLRKQ